MSWKLQVGEIQHTYVTDKDIWHSIHHFFYHGKNTATYKFGLFKALLEVSITANEQFEISYDRLFYSYTKIYWNLIIGHGLWQTNSRTQVSSVQKVIEAFAQSHSIPSDWNFEKLTDVQKVEIIQQVKRIGKKYVIGAMYGDFNGDIYSFDLKREYLKIHPKYLQLFQTYKRILTNVANYQLALFLEKFNHVEKVQCLLTKVEFITARQSLREFQQLLQQAGIEQCFYCQKPLRQKIHVDHFIPWSYFQNDLLWNFVLACPSCNTRKNDKLAAPMYLETLIERNNTWQSKQLFKEQFSEYTAGKLQNLYQYAESNGIHSGWTP